MLRQVITVVIRYNVQNFVEIIYFVVVHPNMVYAGHIAPASNTRAPHAYSGFGTFIGPTKAA